MQIEGENGRVELVNAIVGLGNVSKHEGLGKGCSPEVKRLPSRHKTLDLILSTAKKGKSRLDG